MRVSISPWEIAETSLHVAAAKKRRRVDLGVMARFVSHRRSTKKSKGASENLLPAMMVTGTHRISVMGSKFNDSTTLKESEVLQYASRPGKSTAFLPSNKSSIPALYDSKQERLYAFQNGNKRLMSWPATSGPDEAETVMLDVPALDLTVFRDPMTGNTLLYGSCSNGKLFFVNIVSGTNAMKVTYVKSPEANGTTDRVLLTLARSLLPKDSQHGAGSKRKPHTRKESSEQSLMVYQVAKEANAVKVVCQHIKLEFGDAVQASVTNSESMSMPLAPSDASVEKAQVVGFLEEKNQIGLFYSVDGSESGHFFSLISLDNLSVDWLPIELPTDTQQVGLVGSNVLAVGTGKEVVLLDMMRGTRIHQQDLPDASSDYVLVTDNKRARLSVLFVQDKTICVAVATGKFQAKLSSLQQGSMSLASSLAASLEASAPALETRQFVRSSASLTFDKKARAGSGDDVDQSVAAMLQAYGMVLEGKKEASSPSFLLKAYENAIAGRDLAGNPQDATRTKAKKVNGVHSTPKNGSTINGAYKTNGKASHNENMAATKVPWALVDCAATVVVRLLYRKADELPGTVRSDACQLLKRLVRSEKVLARIHLFPDACDLDSFARLFRAIESVNKSSNGARAYSPVDLAMDIISSCPDVSEKQMVASLHFMLCRATPDDIAYNLAGDSDEKVSSLSEQYRSLTSKTVTGNAEKEVDMLSSQLLKAGANKLLQRMLSYSRCNDSLLRGSLGDGLNRQEMGLLARLLVGTLTDSSSKDAVSLRATQWLSALCDCFRGEPTDSKTLNVALLRRRIADELAKTESILSLKGFIPEDSESEANKPADVATMVHASSKKRAPRPPLAPYQVEHLVF